MTTVPNNTVSSLCPLGPMAGPSFLLLPHHPWFVSSPSLWSFPVDLLIRTTGRAWPSPQDPNCSAWGGAAPLRCHVLPLSTLCHSALPPPVILRTCCLSVCLGKEKESHTVSSNVSAFLREWSGPFLESSASVCVSLPRFYAS